MKVMGKLKKVIIFLIGLFLIFGSHIVYAEKMDISEIGFDGLYITLEDIYALNEEYQKDPDLEIKEAAEFLLERAAKYKEDMDYVHGTDIMGLVICPDNDIGYMNYRTTMFLPYLSSYAGYSDAISLIAFYSGDFCRINVSREELQEFIERNNKLLDEYRTVCEYVRCHLQDNEYSYIGITDNVPCVYLSDESKADILEKQGISWELCKESREDMCQGIQYLWENREELGIVNISTTNGSLAVYGLGSKEEFSKKAQLEIDYYYGKSFELWNVDERVKSIKNLSELEDISLFLLSKKWEAKYSEWGKKFWEEMEIWMKEMKKSYPEYSNENLFTLGYFNREEGFYKDFDMELESFADTLFYTENSKNPFDENEFGDPKRLALKALLREYKLLYPKKSYEWIYDSYVKKIDRNTVLTQEEKRIRYFWKTAQIQQLTKEAEGERRAKQIIYSATAGFGMLIISCGVTIVLKGKKEKIK